MWPKFFQRRKRDAITTRPPASALPNHVYSMLEDLTADLLMPFGKEEQEEFNAFVSELRTAYLDPQKAEEILELMLVERQADDPIAVKCRNRYIRTVDKISHLIHEIDAVYQEHANEPPMIKERLYGLKLRPLRASLDVRKQTMLEIAAAAASKSDNSGAFTTETVTDQLDEMKKVARRIDELQFVHMDVYSLALETEAGLESATQLRLSKNIDVASELLTMVSHRDPEVSLEIVKFVEEDYEAIRDSLRIS